MRRFWMLWDHIMDSDAPDTGVALLKELPAWKRVELDDALGRVLDEILHDDVHFEDALEAAFAAVAALAFPVPRGTSRARLTRTLTLIGASVRPQHAWPIYAFWENVEDALENKTFFYFDGGRDAYFARN